MAGTSAHWKRVVLLLWVLVAFFYFYLSYDYIKASMSDKQFTDYLQYVVQVAATERRPAKEVRALILVKAEELSLPVQSDQIRIQGEGESLKIGVDYNVDIEFPLLQRQIYSKKYEHEVRFRPAF